MRLSDLDGQLYRTTDGRAPSDPVQTVADADILYFQCPKCAAGLQRVRRDDGRGYVEGAHFISVPFAAHDGRPAMGPNENKPAPRWGVTGTSLANVTTTPSIQVIGGCGWHGYVRNGEAVPA